MRVERRRKQVPTDYIALWKFQNNLLDAKGVYDLTGVNTQAYANDREGTPLRAYDTVNYNWAYVDNLNNIRGVSSFSFGAWVYVNSSLLTGVSNGFIGQYNISTAPGTNLYRLSAVSGTNGVGNPTAIVETSTGLTILTATQRIINQWFHLFMTYDGSFLKLYINGVLNNSVAKTGTVVDYNQRFFVNNTVPSGNNGNAYRIDDIVLYNRALSDVEILKIYQNGF